MVSNNVHKPWAITVQSGSRASQIHLTESTITASGIPISDDEDLLLKANELIRTFGEEVFVFFNIHVIVYLNVHVIVATRLPSKLNNRPLRVENYGIIKPKLAQHLQ